MNKSSWPDKGIFSVGGWHPLPARLRRSVNQPEDLESQYEWDFSEERVQLLASNGVNLVLSQFDRGLSNSDAAEDHARAKRLSGLCHRYGLKHGSYLANTVYFESMLKDHPECEDWVVKTHKGTFSHYGGEQTFRWVACFNSPGWRERMKDTIQKAIEYVNTDLLHFDNLAVWPEPDGCHCIYCQKKFREFLYSRYPSDADQKFRFGYTGFETFRIPNFYENFQPAWSFDRFVSPLIQDYIDFRCETVTDYIKDLSQYARSLNPDIMLDSNGQSISGVNRALVHGINSEAQLKYVDIMCDECPDFREDNEADAVPKSILKFRSMKQARQLGKAVFTAFKDAKDLAFNLAFGGSPGIFMEWGYAEQNKKEKNPLPEDVQTLLNHFQANQNLYGTLRPAAKIAVLRSQKSLSYISTSTHLSACVLEQTLFNRCIPFTIIGDEGLSVKGLKEIDLLILPDVEYLSDDQEKIIKDFVLSGKSLMLTEATGQFKGTGRIRKIPAFNDIFNFGARNADGEKENASLDPSNQFKDEPKQFSETKFAKFGAGRAVYVPEIQYRHQAGSFESKYNIHYNGIDSRYWKEPLNTQELLNAMQWLKADLYPVKLHNAKNIFIDTVELRDKSQACMIFRAGDDSSPLTLRFSVKASQAPVMGNLYIPGNDKLEKLEWKKREDYFETELRGIKRLAIISYILRKKPKKGKVKNEGKSTINRRSNVRTRDICSV